MSPEPDDYTADAFWLLIVTLAIFFIMHGLGKASP